MYFLEPSHPLKLSISANDEFPLRVKLRRTQSKHMFSGLPSTADIDVSHFRLYPEIRGSKLASMHPKIGYAPVRAHFFRVESRDLEKLCGPKKFWTLAVLNGEAG
jgi:hypothetical protein